jgi:hypothetical protein
VDAYIIKPIVKVLELLNEVQFQASPIIINPRSTEPGPPDVKALAVWTKKPAPIAPPLA